MLYESRTQPGQMLSVSFGGLNFRLRSPPIGTTFAYSNSDHNAIRLNWLHQGQYPPGVIGYSNR